MNEARRRLFFVLILRIEHMLLKDPEIRFYLRNL